MQRALISIISIIIVAIIIIELQVRAFNDLFMGLNYIVYTEFYGTIATNAVDGKEYLIVNGAEVEIYCEKDPASIPCGAAGADNVCESR